MEHTLKKESQYLWYFNNGVTIVCDAAKEITEQNRLNLRVANAQIINGQQVRTSPSSTRGTGNFSVEKS